MNNGATLTGYVHNCILTMRENRVQNADEIDAIIDMHFSEVCDQIDPGLKNEEKEFTAMVQGAMMMELGDPVRRLSYSITLPAMKAWLEWRI